MSLSRAEAEAGCPAHLHHWLVQKKRAGTAPLSAVGMELSFVSVVCLCIPLVVRGSFAAVRLNTSPATYNGESLANCGGVGCLRCWPAAAAPGRAAVRRLVHRVKNADCHYYHAENEENILDRASGRLAKLDFSLSLHHPVETGDSTRFPDETSVAVEDYNYFISDINLQAIPGKLLIGAA